MRFSKNFTLEQDMAQSETADELGIDNTPNEQQIEQFMYLVLYSLQPVRDRWGMVKVTSGFRCYVLNTAIRGSKTSDHMKGKAADIRVPGADLKDVFNWCRKHLVFGQLIYEAQQHGREPWIHIALPRTNKPNQQCMLWDVHYERVGLGKCLPTEE